MRHMMLARYGAMRTIGTFSANLKNPSGFFSPSNLPRNKTVGSSLFFGKLSGTITGFGRKPGSYSRLKSLLAFSMVYLA